MMRARSLVVIWLPLLLLCAPIIFYQLLVANSFFVITEGAGEYALMVRHGMVPYRDFHLLLPPLFTWELTAFQWLFGDGYRALHGLGIAVTCGIGIALFDILCALFNRWIAAVSATFVMVYYQASNTYFGYDLTQFLTLHLMIAGAFLTRYASASFSGRDEKTLRTLCFAAGLFLGFGILSKQSNGGMTTIFSGIVMMFVAFRLHPFRKAFTHLSIIVAATALPVLLTLAVLAMNGALDAFLSSTVVDATSAKGNFPAVLTGWMKGFFLADAYKEMTRIMIKQLWYSFRLMLGVSLILGALSALLHWQRRSWNDLLRCIPGTRAWKFSPLQWQSALICVAGVGALCLLMLTIYHDACGSLCEQVTPKAWMLYNNAILWSVQFYGVGMLVALAIFLYRPNLLAVQLVVILGFGVGLTFGNGTSAGLSEISAFLGVAILLAFAVRFGAPYVLPAAFPLALFLIFASLLVETKFSKPYRWWSVAAPDARHITACADAKGILEGVCMPPEFYDKLMRITRDMTDNSAAEEPVYVYPHMLIFYQLADRRPYDGKVVSWFDQMSDRQAIAFSEKLRAAPPVVVVMAELPEEVYLGHERLFRAGNKSGQRQIVQVVSELEASGVLQRIDTVEDVNGLRVVVYKRK